MPAAITAAATTASIALARWYAQRQRNNAARDSGESAWNQRESEAYKRRAVLAAIIQSNPAFARLHLTEDQLKGMVGQPREFTGQAANPGQYADLAGQLLGAAQTYQQAPSSTNTYGEGVLPPDYGPGSDFGPTSQGGSSTRIVPCPDGWEDAPGGDCRQIPLGDRLS